MIDQRLPSCWLRLRLIERPWLVLLVLLAVSLAPVVQAAEDDEDPTLLDRAGQMADDAQAAATERFNRFVSRIDDFFAGETEVENENQSWARIRFDVLRVAAQDPELRGTVKVRLVLPRAKKRFRLLLSSEDDESSEADGQDQQPAIDERQNVSLALRFIRTARRNGGVDFDLGVRRRSGEIQSFVRMNARYRHSFADVWTASFVNNYVHFSKTGFENRFTLDLRRPFFGSSRTIFRTSTKFLWVNGRKGASISETIGVYSRVNKRTDLAFEGEVSYNTSVSGEAIEQFPGGFIRVRLRRNMLRPWFFLELWPTVSFPATRDYEAVYGGLIRAEIVIGKH